MKFAHRFTTVLAAIMMATVLPACSSSAHREGPGEVIDDALITTKVKAALAADPIVKATEVKVETYKGIVQLSGFVDTPEAKKRAVEVAREIKGVKEVKDSLLLRK
jgi:osmotically-inducible protein OsmY